MAKITQAYIQKRKEEVMLKELRAEAFQPWTKKKLEFKNSALYNYVKLANGICVRQR